MGNPVLALRAPEIADPAAPQIAPQLAALVDDMIETMFDAGGLGLAAPQVHVPTRLVVLKVSGERIAAEDKNADEDADQDADQEANDGADRQTPGIPLTAMINPVIEPIGDAKTDGWESCLSLPGMAGLVPRFTRVGLIYQTLENERIELEAAGFYARVLQHEVDHLDGILYPQRMEDLSRFGVAEEINRARGAHEDEQEDAREAAHD